MATVELESVPSLTGLYARAVATALPGGGDELPSDALLVRDVAVEPERVAEYARVCGFGVRDAVPGTYPHVLGFPLQMKLVTERSFPLPVLGLIHIANRIEVAEPIPVGAHLELEARAQDLREHRLGRQVDFAVEARLGGRPAWRGRSTYLRREKSDSRDSASPPADAAAGEETPLRVGAVWRVPGDIGRRYAAVSGDRNPIHMHSLPARALGFPGAIAHGMWTKARCLAAFEGRLPGAYSIDVEFRAPLRIPGRARLLTGRDDGGWRLRVESADGERTHMTGAISG
jgi:acyl dehydratase